MESKGACGPCTKFYKSLDPLMIYDLEYWLYVLTGFWEYKWDTRWKYTLYKVYQSLLVVLYIASLALYVIDVFAVVDDLERLSFNLSSSFLVVVTMLKLRLLYSERENMDDVYIKLQNHLDVKTIAFSEEDKLILRKNADILSTLTFSFYTFLILGFPLRIIADTTLDPKEYLIPMPNREVTDPYFGYIYAQQAVVIFHILVVVLAHDLLIFSVLVRIIAHYEILEKNLKSIGALYPRINFRQYVRDFIDNGENDEKEITTTSGNSRMFSTAIDWIDNRTIRENKAHQMLRENINHHQMLLNKTKKFCQLYSLPLLVQSCGAGFLIGIVILQIFLISRQVTTLFIEQIIFTLTLLLNVFHLCSFATEINTKSRMAANALYDTPWYEMDIRNRRIVQFAMKKMMEGPKLKGGNMVVVNRVTYLKFLRISYNLIAVLRHIY